MTPEIESLFRDVDQAKPDMRATWAYLVNHDSGSKNKAAVDALQAFAAHTLKKCGFSVRFHEYPENRGIYTQSDSSKKSSRNSWSLPVVSVDQRY